MKEKSNEKSLIKINENSILYKVKRFLRNLFNKNETLNNIISNTEVNNKVVENRRNLFLEEIKKIENEETLLLKLQKKYRSGEIKEEELTEEQINSLCKLYDKQIDDLRKIIEKESNQ